MSNATAGDPIHVTMNGRTYPAIVTTADDKGNIEATVFTPGDVQYYAGPLYTNRADADKNENQHPNRAFAGGLKPARKPAQKTQDSPDNPTPGE